MESMRTAWLCGLLSLSIVGSIFVACDSTDTTSDAGVDDAGDPGCCPDVQTGCTLRRYGKKQGPGDTCIVGFDGIVPDPSAPGWTRATSSDGCPAWVPPKNVPLLVCGMRPPEDSGYIDAPEDDAATGSDASDSGDGSGGDGSDGGDAASADAADAG